MGNEPAAEDAVSAGILRAYEHLPELRKNASFKSWLFKIIANACNTALRDKKKCTPVDFESPENRQIEEGRESDYSSIEWQDILAVLSEKEACHHIDSFFRIFFDRGSEDSGNACRHHPLLEKSGHRKIKTGLL